MHWNNLWRHLNWNASILWQTHLYVVCEMMAIKLRSWCKKLTFKAQKTYIQYDLISYSSKVSLMRQILSFRIFLIPFTDYVWSDDIYNIQALVCRVWCWKDSKPFCEIALGWMPMISGQNWFRKWLDAIRQHVRHEPMLTQNYVAIWHH